MKLRFSILFSLLLSISVFAQEFKYGISGSVKKSTIVGIHDFSRARFGGNLGMFGNWALVENDIWDSAWLYLEPKIEFSTQGENADAREGWQTFDHWYVASEVYLKYFFHRGNLKRDAFLFAGPKVEYLVREKRTGPPVPDKFIEQEKEINKFGVGVSFGVGLKVSERIEGTIRYDWGFSKIYPDYTKYHTYNRFLAVGFNYYLSRVW